MIVLLTASDCFILQFEIAETAASPGIVQENLCKNTSSTLSQVISGYMFDTLVYYSLAKQYMVLQDKVWNDFLKWANEPSTYRSNTKLQLIGRCKVRPCTCQYYFLFSFE